MIFKIITTVVIGLYMGIILAFCGQDKEKKRGVAGAVLSIPYIMALICIWGKQ